MKHVAIIGAGKLGFPVGCVMASKGHDVVFYDVDQEKLAQYQRGIFPQEAGLEAVVPSWIRCAKTLEAAIVGADIVFIAVQTPHAPEQDGSQRFHHVRENFDLTYVKQAVVDTMTILKDRLNSARSTSIVPVVIISTMLPGSMDNEILPLIEQHPFFPILYSPLFIAMGTVVHDFQNPEFWLIGGDLEGWSLADFYRTINPRAPVHIMSYASAEATKCLYNTWITMKLTLTNLAMEIAHKIPGANAGDIMKTLQAGKDRITSSAYMNTGMVDGGGCHPRDNIAMSWLSDKLGLKYNLFDFMMETREKQVEFLADLVEKHKGDRQVVLSSRYFKAGTEIEAGSPALLLSNILTERGIEHTFDSPRYIEEPICLVATTAELTLDQLVWKPEDIVIDPWGMLRGPNVISVGVGK